LQAVVLAAGYATRLRPLTDTIAKPLLPLGGRPMIDYIYDKLAELGEVESVHVVTNSRFAGDFERWAREGKRPRPVTVHDDGTRTNDDRLGAIGDIEFTIEQGSLAGDDLLVIAGDNLFEFSLREYAAFWRGKAEGSCIAVYDCRDPELVKQYSVVELDSDDRVISFVEKPKAPRSTLASIATYLLRARDAALIRQYLAEGNSPDQPGHLIAWLHKRAPVYGYRFEGEWLDIGDREQLLEADNLMRARNGLPRVEEYVLES
jgi:glucose-1-phosphate thymidylyltransferase